MNVRRLLWKFGLVSFFDICDAAAVALTPVDRMRLMEAIRDQQDWWPAAPPNKQAERTDR